MLKTYTCIICPVGCDITVRAEQSSILSIEGNCCPKGADYVEQELSNPRRNIATSVMVHNGDLPLVSVRLNRPIPKDQIFTVMAAIKNLSFEGPVRIGQVLSKDICGTGADLIATKNVDLKKT